MTFHLFLQSFCSTSSGWRGGNRKITPVKFIEQSLFPTLSSEHFQGSASKEAASDGGSSNDPGALPEVKVGKSPNLRTVFMRQICRQLVEKEGQVVRISGRQYR